jgi:hypothetical protein
MFMVRQVRVGLVIVGIALMVQGCWENDVARGWRVSHGGWW